MNILLVEDNPADARLVREALLESGAPVDLHWAADAADALRVLRRSAPHADAPTPDLVLLDLNLPGMGGKELLAEIKCDASLATIPVVVLTSSAARQDVLDAYRLHANSYMIKPADFEACVALVGMIKSHWLESVLLPTRVGG